MSGVGKIPDGTAKPRRIETPKVPPAESSGGKQGPDLAQEVRKAAAAQFAQQPPQVSSLWRYQPLGNNPASAATGRKIVIDTSDFLISDGAIATRELTVDNPLYETRPKESTRRYEGYRLIDILGTVPNLQDFKAIKIHAEDGYATEFTDIHYDAHTGQLTARVAGQRVDIGAGFLAIRDLDAKDESDGSPLWDRLPPKMKDGKEEPRGTEKNRTAGPAWLVFPMGHPLHDKTNYWPYQAVRIELIPK